jgi:hypothetical protein
MSEKSKMPIDWAFADAAIRLSMVCLVKIWNKVEVENPSFRLRKHLVKFPNGHFLYLSATTQVPIGKVGYQSISKDVHSPPPSF